MKQIESAKASLIRPVVTLPKTSCGSRLDTPEKRQALYKLQDEIWRAFLKALENPIRQIHSRQFRIIEVLGAVRFYISHSTGEIHLKLRARPGTKDSAFEGHSGSYNLDLPLYDINLTVEAFAASWNKEIFQADKNFIPSAPIGMSLHALFKGESSFYIRLISSISKAIQKSVLWDTLRHQVRDALKIEPEILRIARRALTVRKLRNRIYLNIDHLNNVIKHIEGYRQLDKEAPNLLWLYTIALEEKVIPKGELIQALKKMLVYYSGCKERGWRLILRSSIRDLEPAIETNGSQWEYLVEYIKLHNLLDRNQAIPRKAIHLFNEPHWTVNTKNKIFYRGVEVKPALLNGYINAAVDAENLDDFAQDQALPVFTWLIDAKPALDKNQLKSGWSWLVKAANAWLENSATEARLSLIKWECKLGNLTLGQYKFVPLINAWQVRQEALRNRNCADHFIERCQAGTYRLYSVLLSNGKHKATLGMLFENDNWGIHQIKSFANQPVSVQLHNIADAISEGLNLTDEGASERAKQLLEAAPVITRRPHWRQQVAQAKESVCDVEEDDGDDCSNGSFCPICGEEDGSCAHLIACSDRFGGGIVGGVVYEKKDEMLEMVTSLFEYCIKHWIDDCGLGRAFNELLSITKERESEGASISDILWEHSQPIEYAICDLIDEDTNVIHTSWDRDCLPGMSTTYDNYWANNAEEVLLDLGKSLIEKL